MCLARGQSKFVLLFTIENKNHRRVPLDVESVYVFALFGIVFGVEKYYPPIRIDLMIPHQHILTIGFIPFQTLFRCYVGDTV